MRAMCLAVIVVGFAAPDAAVADHRTVRTPRVYGATGRPYGPTQSHYQYERQYGRAWHGYGGNATPSYYYGGAYQTGYYPPAYFAPVIVNGYPINGPIGLPGYAPVYGNTFITPPVQQGYPLWTGGSPFNNDAMRQAQLENDLRWQAPVILGPVKSSTQPKRMPSSPEAKLKSLHAQGRGDRFMRKQEYREAYKAYREATHVAPDRAEAQFRLAFSLVSLGQYQAAVTHFQRGLELDPALPVTGISLGKLLGRDNGIAKETILTRVMSWTKEDIRDPDRLFVLGVLLHYDNRVDQSALVFEAAYRLAGRGEHLAAFLREQKKTVGNVIAGNVPAQQIQKPPAKPSRIVEIAPPVPPIESNENPAGPMILPPLPNP